MESAEAFFGIGTPLFMVAAFLFIPPDSAQQQIPQGVSYWADEWPVYCPPSSGVAPLISRVSGFPNVGETMTITYFAGGNHPCWLITGPGRSKWGNMDLPWTLPNSGGCVLGVEVDQIYSLAMGGETITYTIPNDPLLIGTESYLQMLVQDSAANPSGFTTSRLKRMVIGR